MAPEIASGKKTSGPIQGCYCPPKGLEEKNGKIENFEKLTIFMKNDKSNSEKVSKAVFELILENFQGRK